MCNEEWLEPDRLIYYHRNQSGICQLQDVKPHGGWDGAGTGLRGYMVGHWLCASLLSQDVARHHPRSRRRPA